ncbi:MAG: hypothetical protein AAF995_08590 [Planctomycetota bacterium]
MTTAPNTIESLLPHIAPARARIARLRMMLAGLIGLRMLAITIAVGGGALALLMLLDGALRLPRSVRLLNFTALSIWTAGGVARAVWGVLRTRLTLVDLALLVGRDEGERIASAIDLADQPAGDDPVGEAMRVRAVERLARELGGGAGRIGRAVRTPRVSVPLLVACAVLLGLGGFAWRAPASAGIAFARSLAPWSDAAWPTRVLLEDRTEGGALAQEADRVRPADEALLLSGAAGWRSESQDDLTVIARVRLSGPGAAERARRWTRYVLTPQARETSLTSAAGDRIAGRLHERLIDAGGLGLTPDLEAVLEYELSAEDAAPVRGRVRLVPPPRVSALRATITPPAYAAGLEGVPSGEVDLLARGEPAQALEGSRIELRWSGARAVPEGGTPDWATLLDAPDARVEADRGERGVVDGVTGGVVSFEARRDVRAELALRDEHGIASREPVFLLLDALPDGPPAVVVTEPTRDEPVLATALITLRAEATDDLALHTIHIEALNLRLLNLRTSDGESSTAPDWAAATRLGEDVLTRRPREAALEATLDLDTLGLVPGDEVWVAGVALDLRQHDAGEAGTRSTPRRLRVITPEVLVEQLRTDLAGVRAALRRLDETQRDLENELDGRGATAGLGARQRSLAGRIGEQREQLEGVLDRQARNRLDDGALRSVAQGAASLLREAADAAEQAASSAAAGDNQATQSGQERARDRLGEAARRLDEGQDAWQARRSLERLLDEQRDLLEQTREAGDRLLGRTREELTPEERSTLDELADRQSEAAERARESLDELTDRAEALRESDGVQSAALEAAAARGRRSALGERLEQAAENLSANQSGEAQQEQQAGIEALEQMLADVDDANRNRDAALRRQIATLRSSIEGLILQQEREIARLDEAEASGGPLLPLRDGMERLRVNTLGVRADGEGGFGELRDAAAALDAATEAQGRAVAALSGVPGDTEGARADELRSLGALRRALREAEQADEDAAERERDRVQRELREAYRESLERLRALVEPTSSLLDRPLSRRERSEARRVSGEHASIADALRALPQEYPAVSEAPVLEFAHRRLDTLLGEIAGDLRGAPVAGAVAMRQGQAIALLETLLEALDPNNSSDDFESGGSGGGGSGGAPGEDNPVPPLAELLILRGMQSQLAEATRTAGDAGDGASLDALADWQRELGEQARELLERAREDAGGGPPSGPGQIEPLGEPEASDGGTTSVEGA